MANLSSDVEKDLSPNFRITIIHNKKSVNIFLWNHEKKTQIHKKRTQLIPMERWKKDTKKNTNIHNKKSTYSYGAMKKKNTKIHKKNSIYSYGTTPTPEKKNT